MLAKIRLAGNLSQNPRICAFN